MDSTVILQLSEKLLDRGRSLRSPLVVAIDGRSGVGKSTLAAGLAAHLDATIVSGDDFYIGGVAVRDEAPEILYDACIDWRAARGVLRNLVGREEARYRGFDWERFDGSLRDDDTVLRASPIILFEGVYAGRLELRDVVDLSVLVHLSETERLRRIIAREGEISAWEAQWHRAEEWYFSEVVSREDFDLVVDNERLIGTDAT